MKLMHGTYATPTLLHCSTGCAGSCAGWFAGVVQKTPRLQLSVAAAGVTPVAGNKTALAQRGLANHKCVVCCWLLLLLLLLSPEHYCHRCCCVQPKWHKVKGLKDHLGDGHVVSNMAFKTAPLTFKTLQNLKEGHAVFTMPSGQIKCPGAGQKACYISEGMPYCIW